MALVDAVAGLDVDDVADHQRRAGGEVVREDVELLDHVVAPQDVGVDLGLELLVLHAVVLAVAEAVGVGGHDLAAVRDVVDAVVVDVGRRADALLRPVVDAAGGQLVVGHLPEELAVGGAERHHHALVAFGAGAAPALVVGADVDLPAMDDRAGVGLRAELLVPLDVLAAGDVPGRGQTGLARDHVARRRAAEHRRRLGAAVGGEGGDAGDGRERRAPPPRPRR